jgi:hypothetical protein
VLTLKPARRTLPHTRIYTRTMKVMSSLKMYDVVLPMHINQVKEFMYLTKKNFVNHTAQTVGVDGEQDDECTKSNAN